MAKRKQHDQSYLNLIKAAMETGRVKFDVAIQDEDWIRLEGSREAIEFLGNLLVAYARSDDPTWLVLDGDPPMFCAGSLGLYVHCIDKEGPR